jgi:hypothetical protein
MTRGEFNDQDRRQLEERGVTLDEARRQLELLTGSPRHSLLVRPATPGDGVVGIRPEEVPELQALHAEAARAGRCLKFTPASGAATRMFRELLHFQQGPGRQLSWSTIRRQAEQGAPEASALVTVVTELRRFAFCDDLEDTLRRRGEELDGLARIGAFQTLLDALLDADGLGYARLPKGLLKFHGYEEGSRTAFEEHLVEAAHYARDDGGSSRLHLTVSPEHRKAFEARLRTVEEAYRRRYATRYEVDYSVQDPATDTLSIDSEQRPLRDPQRRLRFRPGGHGALIRNLDRLRGDLVFVKNIDNVQPDRLKQATLDWKQTLAGYLIQLQRRVFDYLVRLRDSDSEPELLDEALRFIRRDLHVELDTGYLPPGDQSRRAFALRRLNRPLRVCGVVKNTGEPGGGPFWVRDREGTVALQIVEPAQVDPDDAEQRKLLRCSTHFNPVDLVCAPRDVDGTPFDLGEFVDPDATIVTRKSDGGRDLRVLELPGLWNGAMAGWNTVFVEVPLETFSPVKSVLDLLRPEHQPQ